MKIITGIKALCGLTTSVLSYLFGGLDMLLSVLVFCIVTDYISGVMAALYEKKLNSERGFKGILKKIAILTVVALAYQIGRATGAVAIRDCVIGFYIANEGISILENCGRMELPVFSGLKDILEQLRHKDTK